MTPEAAGLPHACFTEGDARECYELRYYGIAGLGAPDWETDDGVC